jgi:hypothetical protein
MPHFEFYEPPQDVQDKILTLRWQISANRVLLAGYRLIALLEKANFNPNQPRVPRGNTDGGQWTNAGGSSRPAGQDRPSPVWLSPPGADIRPRAIVHNPDPPLTGEPPHIPTEPPNSGTVRNTIIRTTVRLLVGAARSGSPVRAGLWAAIEAATWAKPYIRSYFDGPKSLEDLQRAVSDRKTGYDVHHVVERASASKAGFPSSLIEASENLVRIPTLKHWEVNAWFEKARDSYGGLTPREYLRNPKISWEERMQIGKSALIDTGVLKQ